MIDNKGGIDDGLATEDVKVKGKVKVKVSIGMNGSSETSESFESLNL